ncbi:MAG TPA: hypothetical protein VK708_19050 [Bryobacteraceae bacterium]|jgi:hypothetical protein|nr:hypothetical protein [Bryobacteraceae bacterium]
MRRLWMLAAFSAALYAQRPAEAPRTAQAAAPIDLTGYWVSQIVDEWRFRVTPQKGDIVYLPINAQARKIALAWDPDKDTADGEQCKAYGAVGVMQRPGRLHVSWKDESTLQIDADSGTQTRSLHFGQASAPAGDPTWQGYSSAQWEVRGRALIDLGGIGFVAGGGRPQPTRGQGGTLKVVTTKMRPGYIRKNGVPYSGNAVLTEYMNILAGQQGDTYLTVTATVEDPAYLNQPFLRTYTFKKATDAAGWDPTPCWPK